MAQKCSWCTKDAGLLVLRIGVGMLFLFTGWLKISDIHATVGEFGSMGFVPFWAYLVTAAELLGGLGILLGAWTRFCATMLAIVMVVATYVTHGNVGMVMTPFMTLFATIALALSGAGKYAVHKES